METRLQEKCDLFIKNREAINRKFPFEKSLMKAAAALIFTGVGKEADVERLGECRKLLAKRKGAFSTFRAVVELPLLTRMALSEDPEQCLEDVIAVNKKLQKGKIFDNAYIILAAILICDQGKSNRVDAVIEKYKELFKRMDKKHPFITSDEDLSYAALMALSDRDTDLILKDMEECYRYLKKTCKLGASSNALQGLSELFAMTDGNHQEKCERIAALYKLLKEKKAEVSDGTEFTSFGPLAETDAAVEALAEEIIEADAYLEENKVFSSSSDKKTRLMIAAIIVSQSYGIVSPAAGNTFITGSLELIKAGQTALMVNIILNVAPSMLSSCSKKEEEPATE